jgi:hypothetical protein
MIPMRRFALAGLALARLATGAQAATRPKIKPGTPYPEARARLIAAGFVPVRILRNGPSCGGAEAPCRNEKLLYGGIREPWSQWLFARRADDALFIVWTGEGVRPSSAGLDTFDAYEGIVPARLGDLRAQNLLIVLPSGRERRFANPPTRYVEPSTPLCSETGGVMPCWVKPPPDDRPPPRGARR